MIKRSVAGALPLLMLGTLAAAQDSSGTRASDGSPRTVKREDVRSWTMTVDGKEWSVRPAAPTYEGDTGLFRLSTAYTIPKGKFSVGVFRDNHDRDPKGVDLSIHGFNLSYGATDKLQIFGNVGIQNRVRLNYPADAGYNNELPFASDHWTTGFGDVKLGLKYAFLNDYRGDAVGLALRGIVKLPTASDTDGLGTGKTAFAGDLILSKTINYGADLHASVGYEVNSDPDGLDLPNAFRWGVGLNIPACTRFQLQAELTGRSYSSTTPKQTSTVDLIAGPAVWFGSGWYVRPAISYALNYDDRGQGSGSSKKIGKHIEIGYHPGTPCCEVYTPPPPASASDEPAAHRVPELCEGRAPARRDDAQHRDRL